MKFQKQLLATFVVSLESISTKGSNFSIYSLYKYISVTLKLLKLKKIYIYIYISIYPYIARVRQSVGFDDLYQMITLGL